MSEVIRGTGINQADLISLLTLIRTNFAGVTAKLDLDSGVADTNYASLENFSAADGVNATGIRHQGVVLDYLKSVRTSFNALLTKLDADGQVNSTDYNATYAVASLIDNLALGSLLQNGVYDGSLVKWLSTYITNWNLALAHLDVDSGVTGTNFASLWAISAGLVDATGCVNKP